MTEEHRDSMRTHYGQYTKARLVDEVIPRYADSCDELEGKIAGLKQELQKLSGEKSELQSRLGHLSDNVVATRSALLKLRAEAMNKNEYAYAFTFEALANMLAK